MRRIMMIHRAFLVGLWSLVVALSACSSQQDDQGSDGTGGGAGTPEGLVDDRTPVEPGAPGSSDVTFTIRSDQERHAISPLIYGTNGGAVACGDSLARPTLCRLGGNRWTAYNWENNASNAGSDWCYQNDSHLADSDEPGLAVTETVDRARDAGAATLVTIPMVDYVAADKQGGSGPPECSGDVRNSGTNYLSTRFVQNQAQKSASFSNPPDTTDTTVSQDEFVAFLKGAAGDATILFDLDNEPDLWEGTHEEVHPDKVTYAELVERSVRFASAIREVWEEAEIAGFVSYGYNGFLSLQDAPDKVQSGTFVDYFLAQMKQASDAAGTRLIDYLDLHWYSEAQGGGERVTNGGTSGDTVAARLAAPRSLWDPTYTEDSWITNDVTHAPIRLIPWLQDSIDANYPGTQLAFSEWEFGAGDHISGAIATADVLGIFGRYQVGLASYWPLSDQEDFARAAFAAYRNYDGQASTFGDVAIAADTSDIEGSSVYASVDADDPDRIVIIAINKTAEDHVAGITIAHPLTLSQMAAYQLTQAEPRLIIADPVQAVDTNAFSYSMPAFSVSVLVPSP